MVASTPTALADGHRYLGALVFAVALFVVSEPVSAQDLYGSMAFAQTGDGGYAGGIAWNAQSHAKARQSAIDECRWAGGGSACREVGWFRNACGAIAIGDGDGYGTGWGDSSDEAERAAMNECRSQNNTCHIEITRCTELSVAVGIDRAARRRIQSSLAAQGFDPGAADGIFGSRTQAALRAWQASKGYAATGTLTSEQARILRSLQPQRTKASVKPAAPTNKSGAPVPGDIRDESTVAIASLRDAEVNPDARDADGRTSLHRSIYGDDSETTAALLRSGSDPNARDKDGETPLHKAAYLFGYYNGNDSAKSARLIETANLLLQAGADPNGRNDEGMTPLHFAGGDDARMAMSLLDAGADPNARTKHGYTLLAGSAGAGHTDVVVALLRAGADPNERGSYAQQTPLHFAAGGGATAPGQPHDTIVALLEAGADPNARDKDGNTPLHGIAVGAGWFRSSTGGYDQRLAADIIATLVGAGADPNARNNGGYTPLRSVTAPTEWPEIVAAFLVAGADPDATNDLGTTLHEYSFIHRDDAKSAVIAALLLDAGADPNAKDMHGRTPLDSFHITNEAEHARTISVLRRAGARRTPSSGHTGSE